MLLLISDIPENFTIFIKVASVMALNDPVDDSKIPLPFDKWIPDVTVGHVETASKVWVSLQKNQNEAMDKLSECESSLQKLDPAKVAVGKMCATVFSEDGILYRSVILNTYQEEVQVRYCDFGNKEKVKKASLIELPKDMENTPAAAVEVFLEGSEGVPNDEKSRTKTESKLTVEGKLQVKLARLKDGTISAKFALNGKKVKLHKVKESKTMSQSEKESKDENVDSRPVDPNKDSETNSGVIQEVSGTEIAKPVETSNGQYPTMCSQLPSLKLLDGVQTLGSVVHVSAIGTVWFTPNWILAAIENLNGRIDEIHQSKSLLELTSEDVCIGLLCIARHSDGYLYRARVVDQMKNSVCSVKFIDYGDNENVPVASLFYFPAGLEMTAPGAAEIVLANPPKLCPDMETVLRETLMSEDGLVLVMEEDQSGVKVGKFLKDGNEITWDGLIDAKKSYDKDSRPQEATDDVVLESEESKGASQPIMEKKEEMPKPKEMKIPISPDPSHNSAIPVKSTDQSKEVLMIKQVQPVSFKPNEPMKVFVGSVETVKKVWLIRENEEEKLNELMSKMEKLKGNCTDLFQFILSSINIYLL